MDAKATSEALVATPAENAAASLLAIVLVGGVYADGWAHLNIGGLDTFFTPWHGVLYGGFTLLAGWLLWMVGRRSGTSGPWRHWVPAGYGWGLVGITVFATGGVLDLVWHQLLGVETGLAALVSPTHLLLLIGGVLLVTCPLRGAEPRTTARALPVHSRAAVVSMAAATALVSFFLSYLSVFADPAAREAFSVLPEGAPGHREAELPIIAGLGSYLVTTLLLVVPLLSLRRFARLPHSAVTVVVAAVAVPAAALTQTAFAVTAVGALVAASLLDLLLAVRPNLNDAVLAGLVPGLVWTAQLLALASEGSLRWPVELWSGVVALSVLLAVTLTFLIKPPATATATTRVGLPLLRR